MSAMLEVEGIQTYYGDSHVLHGVSLTVAAGEAVALLGRNGAGKTTVIRSIVGFTPPRAGRIVFDGAAIEAWPAHRIARRGIALVPQGRRIFAPLSVRENLTLGARAAGWPLDGVFALLPRLRPQLFVSTHFLGLAARLEKERPVESLAFLQVELDASEKPTYRFVPGVATTSLAHKVAERRGVTRADLLALVEKKLAAAPKARSPRGDHP